MSQQPQVIPLPQVQAKQKLVDAIRRTWRILAPRVRQASMGGE